jgi:hypothetical protein
MLAEHGLLVQKVGRKSDQGAGSVDILEMLARQIVAETN